jgi:hypothetical protein
MGEKKKNKSSGNSEIEKILESSRREFIRKAGISGAAIISGDIVMKKQNIQPIQ